MACCCTFCSQAKLRRHSIRRFCHPQRIHLSTLLLPEQPSGHQGEHYLASILSDKHLLCKVYTALNTFLTYLNSCTSLYTPLPSFLDHQHSISDQLCYPLYYYHPISSLFDRNHLHLYCSHISTIITLSGLFRHLFSYYHITTTPYLTNSTPLHTSSLHSSGLCTTTSISLPYPTLIRSFFPDKFLALILLDHHSSLISSLFSSLLHHHFLFYTEP